MTDFSSEHLIYHLGEGKPEIQLKLNCIFTATTQICHVNNLLRFPET